MTAIAGLVDWTGGVAGDSSLHAMLAELSAFGAVRQSSRRLGPASFGHVLSIHVPEDVSDRQPVVACGGDMLLTADARIDNRDEIIAALGIDRRDAAALSDGMLLGAAWEKWGEAALDRMLGDMALALWDNVQGELLLARTPATTRSLFYHLGEKFAAFASMPAALHRLDAVPKRLNLDELARRVSGGAFFGTAESCFAAIDSVEPGTIVRIRSDGRRIARFWDASNIAIVRRSAVDAAEEMRAELDRSVEACLRRSGGEVASHLSGGRDSSAVTATAAIALGRSGESLTALTAAPRAGFPHADGGYLHDESGLAKIVAAGLPNLRHVISRSRRVAICKLLDMSSRLHFAPMGGPANIAYWVRLLSEARDCGASTLLTASNGNFSISLGGLGALSDVARQNGAASWWSTAKRLAGQSQVPWRTILNQTFGPHLPQPVHRMIHRWLAGPRAHQDYPLFAPVLGDRIRSVAANADTRPAASYRAIVRQIYRPLDYADKVALADHGIELRDPTADRRMIEFCLSLPADQLVGSQGQRPIYDLAFRDRVPKAVRSSPLKGFQGADWFEIYDPDEIAAGFRRYSANRLVRELVDVDQAFPLLDAWPRTRGFEGASFGLYASHLLRALALASFIDVHFPEQRDR